MTGVFDSGRNAYGSPLLRSIGRLARELYMFVNLIVNARVILTHIDETKDLYH